MAPTVETSGSREAAWYRKITERVAEKAQDGFVPDGPLESGCFDLAEAMESGSAWSLASFVQPPPEGEKNEQRLVLLREPDQRLILLQTRTRETLLMARASSDGCRFDIFASCMGAPPLTPKSLKGTEASTLAPSFALVASSAERKEWTLMSLSCTSCESRGRRRCGMEQIARMRHYLEWVGPNEAYCMDVEYPQKREDGTAAAMCEVCGTGAAPWSLALTSRRPVWNEKRKTLSLNFRGRVSLASAKNFQLESPSGGSRSLFLFGKVADDKFVLDYCSPLGMVQAFAAALSASHWQ
jgi:hypothetical protein